MRRENETKNGDHGILAKFAELFKNNCFGLAQPKDNSINFFALKE